MFDTVVLLKENEFLKEENKRLKENIKLAWAAGLFDGEGCFSINNKGNSYSYNIQSTLNMTDKDTVEDFKDIVKYGKIIPRISKNPKHKDGYYWYCYQSDAVEVAKLLVPYLVCKRRRAELIIEFDSKWRRRTIHDNNQLDVSEFGTLDIIVHEMRLLNMKGKINV